MGELTGEGKTHFGNLKTFYILLYSSAAIFFIALALILTDSPEIGLLILAIALIVMIICFVLFYTILYRLWKFTIAKAYELGIAPSIPTAGQAIGYLFIPFFNFYWLFKGIGKLPLEINAIAKRYDIQKLVPDNLGYIIATLSIVGLIPFVGYVTAAINFLILLPLFIKYCVEVCEQIDISEVNPEILTENFVEDNVDLESTKDTFIEKIGVINKKPAERLTADILNWESAKEYSSLFNKNLFGTNYFIGIALFISLIITRILRIIFFGGYDGSYFPAFDYYATEIAVDLIISILFVVVCHIITKSWWQPFVWGVVIVVVFLIRTQMISNLQYPDNNEYLIKIPMPQIENLLTDFMWGFAFMFGLVFAVNVWGAKIWSLIIGLASSYIIYKALFFTIKYGPSSVEYDIGYFLSDYDLLNIIGRVITAMLIYAALFLHFDNLKSKILIKRQVQKNI